MENIGKLLNEYNTGIERRYDGWYIYPADGIGDDEGPYSTTGEVVQRCIDVLIEHNLIKST